MGSHQEKRAGEAPGPQAGIETGDVAADLWADIGIRNRGRGALELVPLARQLGPRGDEDSRQQAPQLRRGSPLVPGLEVGIEKAHGDRFDPVLPQLRCQGLEFARRERGADAAGAVDALGDLVAPFARNQRAVAMEAQIERLGPVAAADLQHVAKTARRQQRRPRAGALQQCVDHERGAMLDRDGVARLEPRLADAVEDRVVEPSVGGRALGIGDGARFDIASDEVSESATDVDGDQIGHAEIPFS